MKENKAIASELDALKKTMSQASDIDAGLVNYVKSLEERIKTRKLRKELYPYIPDILKKCAYDPETEMMKTALSGSQFHLAVVRAMCEKQRAESANSTIPVIGYDEIKNERVFKNTLRSLGPDIKGFMLLHKDVGRINSLILISGNDADDACTFVTAALKGVRGTTRAGKLIKPDAVRAAVSEEFRAKKELIKTALRDPDDLFCFVVRFADTVAIGAQKPNISVWRDYNSVCAVCKKDGDDVVIDHIFPCYIADY